MRHEDRPTAEVELHVAAAPEQVWPLISDIAFVVGPSAELQAVEWESGDDPEPVVGRRFVGTNRNRHFGEWRTTSTITECDEPTTFAWAVGDLDEPNTLWRFTLRPDGEGTVVVQWMQLGLGDSGLHLAIRKMPDKEERIVERRMQEFHDAMVANLRAIKQAAEAG